jgi:predicted transposase YbfD/YdcC
MRCTAKKTLQVAVASGNDVLVQLKGNQPTLLDAMVALSEQGRPSDSHHDGQIGQRNRIEYRTTSVWPLAEHRAPAQWPGIRCLVQVRRDTEVFDTTLKKWLPRGETAWYVCTRELSACAAAQAVRDHWLIENSLHYVRDVTMGEDASRIRRQPGVFAQLRTWSLNLLRQAGHLNIKSARQILAWSSDALLDLFAKLQR